MYLKIHKLRTKVALFDRENGVEWLQIIDRGGNYSKQTDFCSLVECLLKMGKWTEKL